MLTAILKSQKKVQIEIANISNGDHCFIVIDRRKNSAINNLSTWGENAVIIDAWAGEVYSPLAKTSHNKLMGYYGRVFGYEFRCGYNFLSAYNPKYHNINAAEVPSFIEPEKIIITMPTYIAPEIRYVIRRSPPVDYQTASVAIANFNLPAHVKGKIQFGIFSNPQLNGLMQDYQIAPAYQRSSCMNASLRR